MFNKAKIQSQTSVVDEVLDIQGDAIEKGKLFEKHIVREIQSHFPFYSVLDNVTLELTDGTTQIDVIAMGPGGIVVIEAKAYSGRVFGTVGQPKWTVALNKHSKYSFQNPIRQNYRHIQALMELMGLPYPVFQTMVVFPEKCSFGTEMPDYVSIGLNHRLMNPGVQIFTESQLQRAKVVLQSIRLPDCPETDAKHLASLQARLEIEVKSKSEKSNSDKPKRKFVPYRKRAA